jgi:hypothetical protein
MPGFGKTGTVRPVVAASSARSRDIYQWYAVALYRQALLTLDDSASVEHAACDVIVNERALALVPERADGNARDKAALLRTVMRRLTTFSAVRDGDHL